MGNIEDEMITESVEQNKAVEQLQKNGVSNQTETKTNDINADFGSTESLEMNIKKVVEENIILETKKI